MLSGEKVRTRLNEAIPSVSSKPKPAVTLCPGPPSGRVREREAAEVVSGTDRETLASTRQMVKTILLFFITSSLFWLHGF